MNMVCRVMFDAQQSYFNWCEQAARIDIPADRPRPPSYLNLVNMVTTYRVSGLAELPISYLHLLQSTEDRQVVPSSQLRQATTQVVNPSPDARLMERFRNSGKNTISDLMAGVEGVTIPKQNGKPVCLTWILRGQCNGNCRRRDMHVTTSAQTIRATHAMLTKCGVANPQE